MKSLLSFDGRRLGGCALVVGLAVLSACGGGGGGAPAPASRAPAPTAADTTWRPGVFQAASTYKDRCAAPRQGTDPDGDPWPDRPGSTTLENFWLRSWTHETYLWNDEVADRDPAAYDDPLVYFDLLRTEAVTPSGAPKDDFHFSQPTDDYFEQRNSVPTAGYGASFRLVSASPPRRILVRYTDPGTAASEVVDGRPRFVRGAELLSVDGIDVRDGTDLDRLNAGLYPRTAGETHVFEVLDPGASASRTVTIVSENVVRKPVNRTRIIDTPRGPVGYVLFNTFSPDLSEREIVDAVASMRQANVADLVLDLRYNGGGLLAVASQLSHMIAGPAFTSGKYFERLRFNDDAGDFNPVTGRRNDPVPFHTETLGFSTTAGQTLPTLDLPRVFVLSTEATCSASEAVINGLRGTGFEVVLIGGTTCGKPYGFYPEDNCGETYYTIQFQGVNFRGFGDYADGFVPQNASFAYGVRLPGCEIADDFSRELGDENEGLLAAALHYRRTGSCPAGAVVSSSVEVARKARFDPASAVGVPGDIMDRNRDMRLPGDER